MLVSGEVEGLRPSCEIASVHRELVSKEGGRCDHRARGLVLVQLICRPLSEPGISVEIAVDQRALPLLGQSVFERRILTPPLITPGALFRCGVTRSNRSVSSVIETSTGGFRSPGDYPSRHGGGLLPPSGRED